jgi:hypothetical protein
MLYLGTHKKPNPICMTKPALFLLSMLFVEAIQSQTLDKQSMDKYSCFIEGKNNRNQVLFYASGFIVTHGGMSFLVSSYHVFSGKDPSTGNLLPNISEPPTKLTVWYQSKSDNTYDAKTFSLITKDSTPYYIHISVAKSRIDAAFMHLNIFDDSGDIYSIQDGDLDTSRTEWPNKTLLICGFPYMNESHVVKTYEASSLPPPAAGLQADDVYFDSYIPGLSGCPVFISDSSGTGVKLLGVNSQVAAGTHAEKIKGAAVYIKYVLDIIDFYSKTINKNE